MKQTLIWSSLLFCATIAAHAAITITPPGLNPGDNYRLIFVTDGTTTASSSNITTYNNFVAAEAASITALNELGTTWTAIGSTATVDARDNTGTNPISTGVPIYRLDGVLIANNNADFWDSSIAATVSISPTMATIGTNVWTGTDGLGVEYTAQPGALGIASTAVAGWSNRTNTNWVRGPQPTASTILPLYGISGVLTAVPEPSTYAILMGLLAAATVGIRSRRRVGS